MKMLEMLIEHEVPQAPNSVLCGPAARNKTSLRIFIDSLKEISCIMRHSIEPPSHISVLGKFKIIMIVKLELLVMSYEHTHIHTQHVILAAA